MLDRLQYGGKPAVALQPLQVLHAVAASEVQENHRQNKLQVEPPLPARNPNVPADRGRQTARRNQIQIQRQTRQRRQARSRTLRLTLEAKNSLWQHPAPRW